MAKSLILVPAYGRDYRTPMEACDAFLSGKDFQVADVSCIYYGSYCSRRDLGAYDEVKIRFAKLRRFVFLRRTGDGWKQGTDDTTE